MENVKFNNYIEKKYAENKEVFEQQSNQNLFKIKFDEYIQELGKKSFENFFKQFNNTKVLKNNEQEQAKIKRYFLAYIIAKNFYPNEIIEENGKKHFKKKGLFDKDAEKTGAYYKKIERILGNEGLIIRDSKTLYWLEVLSAMQKESGLKRFNGLNDLNAFIRSIYADNKNNIEEYADIKGFGLYVRNIEQLCYAYTILNGKSSAFSQSLIKKVQIIAKNKNSTNEKQEIREDRNNQITQEVFDEYDIKDLKEEEFLKTIDERYDNFSFVKQSFHTTILTKIQDELKTENDNGYKDVDYETDMAILYDILFYNGFLDKYETIYEEKQKHKKSNRNMTLLEIIEEKIVNPVFKKNVTAVAKDLPKDNILFLRRLLILSIMKNENAKNTEKKNTEQKDAYKMLTYINGKLEFMGLGGLSLNETTTNEIINWDKDVFDWFIKECIIFDEKQQRQNATEFDSPVFVDGFNQFMEYFCSEE